MEPDRQVLQEIRDLVALQLELQREEIERARRLDQEREAQIRASLDLQVAQGRFYKRVVGVAAVLVAALLVYLFSVLSGRGS